MIRFLLSRIGCLMMIFGIIVLALGAAAVQSQQPASTLLLVGLGVTVIGGLLWNRLREKPPRNTRFSMFRKRERRADRKKDDEWEDRFYD